MVDNGRYGREESEWAELLNAACDYLIEVARRADTTNYTRLNGELAERTDAPPFNFDLESERAGMGRLLAEVTELHWGESGALLSAIVTYLHENDAGPGFYRMATRLGLLPTGASRSAKWDFWVRQVDAVHRHYGSSGRA